MKITIDTKEDSHHEIRKVISLLQNLLGETPQSGALSENSSYEDSPSPFNQDSEDSPSSGYMDMFGDNPPPKDRAPVSSASKGSSDDEDSEEESDSIDIPEIIPY